MYGIVCFIWHLSEVDCCELGMVPDDGDREGGNPSLQQDEAAESYASKQTFSDSSSCTAIDLVHFERGKTSSVLTKNFDN